MGGQILGQEPKFLTQMCKSGSASNTTKFGGGQARNLRGYAAKKEGKINRKAECSELRTTINMVAGHNNRLTSTDYSV